jgi:error-prone DNA polymerase
LEDETGVSNLILTPRVFEEYRLVAVHESFLLAVGALQKQAGVVSVKVDRLEAFAVAASPGSHDFHWGIRATARRLERHAGGRPKTIA